MAKAQRGGQVLEEGVQGRVLDGEKDLEIQVELLRPRKEHE